MRKILRDFCSLDLLRVTRASTLVRTIWNPRLRYLLKMYLERPAAEDRGAASGHGQQPQWETTAIKARATGQAAADEEVEEEEEVKVPDAHMYDFLQPAQVRPPDRANQRASTARCKFVHVLSMYMR